MKVGAFPAQAAFLPSLANLWLAAGHEPGTGLIILPSRRAAQGLAAAFLEANNGRALLLPRIIATGAIDEAGLQIAGALSLPPAMPVLRRQAILAKLILGLKGANGAPERLPQAWALAADLAALLDEADYAEADLRARLPNVVAAELAHHWQTTLEFLKIVTEFWPNILAAEGFINPAARLVRLIDAQISAWEAAAPNEQVWMVATGGAPVFNRLAKCVACLTNGQVFLPSYDLDMSDNGWESLEDSHAQAGFATLLQAIGAARGDVMPITGTASQVPVGRSVLLSKSLLPAQSLSNWQDKTPMSVAGMSKLTAADEAQNANAIAMVLRDALERPGTSAALITPDRALAMRVTAALARFGIRADDSAGTPLVQSVPAVFLRLLARAVASEFAPVALLALLQHPLSAAGMAQENFRFNARRLERAALRGPRPGPGFDGIRFRVNQTDIEHLKQFVAKLEAILRPLVQGTAIPPATALRTLIAVAEDLASTPEESGAARLWSFEAGTALSDLLAEAMFVLDDLPDIKIHELPDLLDRLMADSVVRRPRTKDGHPRVAIWGLQEAALQSVDVAVLGGLVEGVWPAAAAPGPWLSRPMRKAAGLASPEVQISTAAHAFFSLAASCKEIVFATPARRERAPAVPARWVTRLDTMLKGANVQLPVHQAASWAMQLDMPNVRETRPHPRPCPDAKVRPKRLSISDITTLMADPYSIYARKILNLKPLAELDQESDQALFGEIVHNALEIFFSDPNAAQQNNAREKLDFELQRAMQEKRPREALQNWWSARLTRIAQWCVMAENIRLDRQGIPVTRLLERDAEMPIDGGYTLTGRVDRIEANTAGDVTIIDYKTGSMPNNKDIFAGNAPQLPLEAVMARAGAFGDDYKDRLFHLLYWKLSGRHDPGSVQIVKSKNYTTDELIDIAAAELPALFAKYALQSTPYLATPHPDRKNRFQLYEGISRASEWGDEEGIDDGD